MNIFVAIDSFKGSFSSKEALAVAIEALPNHHVEGLPVSDGGEGLLECLEKPMKGVCLTQAATGTLGGPIEAHYLWAEQDQTAVIEVAQAAGLTQVSKSRLNPFLQTSYGVGEQILQALDKGAKHVLIGLGGSATMDGGFGLLQALGVRFYDSKDGLLPLIPLQLDQISRIDLKELDPRIDQTNFSMISDVTNPLLGENGTVHIFGEQKGLQEKDQLSYENSLTVFSDLLSQKTDRKMQNEKGAGAAGGIGFALYTICHAKYLNGVDFIMQATHLEEKLKQADLIFTGEGKFDRQSFNGKLPLGIAKIAKKYQKPVILFCGSNDTEMLSSETIDVIFPIGEKPQDLTTALSYGKKNLAKAMQRVAVLLELSRFIKSR